MILPIADQLTLAIVGHLVGDYILQNDWMALNKKRGELLPPEMLKINETPFVVREEAWRIGTLACGLHCLLWTSAVCLFAGWYAIWWVWIVLFIAHFIQDRTTIIARWMKFNGQEKFMGPPLGPWSIIVVDNVWHIVTLAGVAVSLAIFR